MLDLGNGEKSETKRQRIIRWVWRGFDALVLALIAATALSYWADGEGRTAFWVAATCVMSALAMAESVLTRKALRLSDRWRDLYHAERGSAEAARSTIVSQRETIASLRGELDCLRTKDRCP